MMLSVIFIILLGQATRYENQGASNYWPLTLTLRLLLPATISIYGVTKRSLDSLGGTLALVVGVIHSVANCSFSYSMIAFFIFGSLLSKWKMNTKQLFEPIEDSGILLCDYAISIDMKPSQCSISCSYTNHFLKGYNLTCPMLFCFVVLDLLGFCLNRLG